MSSSAGPVEREPVSTRFMRALSRGMGERRSFHAPEVYGRAAIGRIAREYACDDQEWTDLMRAA